MGTIRRGLCDFERILHAQEAADLARGAIT